MVVQANLRLHLILNLSVKPDEGMPSVNNINDRDITPDLIQFGQLLPRILQTIWVADPTKGPVRVSKLDVTDGYHRGTLWMSQMGSFAYVVPSDPEDDCIIIFINLVLLIVWVEPLTHTRPTTHLILPP